jgi:hypothetical protein
MQDTMHVTIPYTYECDVRRPRKRKYVRERFGAFAELDIPSLTQEEAPVAVVRTEGWEGEENDQVETRWFDGAFWEMSNRSRGGTTMEQLLEISTDNPLTGSDYEARRAIDFAKGDYRGSPKDLDHQPWSNTQDKVLAGLLEHAQSLILVDGVVWRQVAEPVLKLEQQFSFGGDTVRIAAETAPEGPRADVDRGYQTFYFRADRGAEAEAFADVLSKLFSPNDGRWYSKARMEVLMPETLSWKDEANDLVVGAGFVMRGFKESETEATQQTSDWEALRDAWNEHRRELTDETADALMDALEDFMDHHGERRDYTANLFHAMCRRYEIAHGTFNPDPSAEEAGARRL